MPDIVVSNPHNRDPWEIEHDARVLKEYSAIKADPTRLSDAQAFIKKEIEISQKALGRNPISRHNNPATVGSFNFK